ncbi:MAG TPA: hypothetical protein VMW87_11590 [Spirochaetia bacterium]|nr:hypothetical protein [Spirochaetia bacterium]
MKSLRRKLTISLLGVAVLIAGAMNITLRPGVTQVTGASFGSVTRRPGVEPLPNRSAKQSRAESEAAGVSPVRIAAALGWTPPVPHSNLADPPPPGKPPPTAQPVEGNWIRYVGAIIDADGLCCRYFKDERSGRMIRAAVGRRIEDWLLTECGDGFYLLDNGDVQLRVRMEK